jgi:lysosomal Pro-X carboxypeptidase
MVCILIYCVKPFFLQEGMCQANYPYQIGDTPAWPVNVACQTLVTALNTCSDDSSRDSCLVQAAASVTNMTLGTAASSSCFATLPEGPGNIPGDGPGLTSWGYQSCTETLHEFSSRGIRDYVFDFARSTAPCGELYQVAPDTNVLTARYGGYNLGDGNTEITNIIWSNGLLDPWHGGGFKEEYGPADAEARGMHFFLLEQGAHHLDLRGFHPQDPQQVVQVRRREEEIMWGWIQQFLAKRGGGEEK